LRHTPVLLSEMLKALAPQEGECFLDLTLGGGGHSRAILDRTGPDGRLLGIDRDAEAIAAAQQVLARYEDRVQFFHGNFADFDQVLTRAGIESVDGMLADLGSSAIQLDETQRGFSFLQEGPLDMRMDRNERTKARDLVNQLSEKELAGLLWKNSEERHARKIAKAIAQARALEPIETTAQLATVIRRAVGFTRKVGRADPATKTFQALRIAVNREIESLEAFLSTFARYLKVGGRIAVISFHSLEDRPVKRRFRELASSARFELITRKPWWATPAEIAANRRSRSARLRALRRLR